MILVLSDGGSVSNELYRFLGAMELPNIFHFSSFEEAGSFGHGNTIVGKAGYKSFQRLLIKNRISAVIDVIEAPQCKASGVMLAAAGDMNIPVIKVIFPVLRLGADAVNNIIGNSGISVVNNYSYKKVAECVNNTVGSVLFLSRPHNVKAVADLVFDRSDVYAPIPAGVEFDVELALEYGIPLVNVIAVDNFSDENGIKEIIRRVGARILITDSSIEILDKLRAASKTGCNVIFTQNTGFEYEYIADSFDLLTEMLKELNVLADNLDAEPESEDEINSENTDINTEEVLNENSD